MFLSDRTMKLLMELDAPTEQKVALLASMRDDERAAAPTRSKGAERQARYEERKRQKASESVSTDAVRHVDDAPRPLPPSPPAPPQPPTPTRECISSREALAREEAGFGRFWQAYPRKTAKADARKAFAKAWRKLDGPEGEQALIGGLERAKAAWVDAQFIPHAATWLNGERWNDEPDLPSPAQPRQTHNGQRPHPDAKLAARQANYARAFAGSESAALRRREPH